MADILVVSENRAGMDPHTVQHIGCQLIGRLILVLLFHLIITPDYILSLVEILRLVGVLGDVQCRNMVAVHDQNHLFIVSGKSLRQFFYKLIHLVNLVDVVFILVLRLFAGRLRHLNPGIGDHLLTRILPVPLHRNRIDIVPALCGFHRIHNL